MDADRVVKLEDLAGLSPEGVIALLDATWPWPLDAVQTWFEGLWNSILSWIHSAVDWIYDRVKPLFDTVWGWLSSWFSWLQSAVSAIVASVWGWIVSEVGKVYQWIKDEVLKVWSWITTEVGKAWGWIEALGVKVWGWIVSEVRKVSDWITALGATIWDWIKTEVGNLWTHVQSFLGQMWQDIQNIAGVVAKTVGNIYNWFSNEFIDPFLDWLIQFPGKLWDAISTGLKDIGSAIVTYYTKILPSVFSWLATNIPKALNWLMSAVGKLLATVVDWGLDIFGFILGLVQRLVTPIFEKIFNWFEKLGPVSPEMGVSVAKSMGSLLTVTMAGLGAMTIAGELLHPLKNLGFGSLAAMLYDLTNYKMLTAAFISVMALTYITKPLTMYYNKAARPNMPREQALVAMAQERVITSDEYGEQLQWYGYPDSWIDKLKDIAYNTLSPRMLTSFANAGILDEGLLNHALTHSGYDDYTIPFIKQMMHSLSAGDLKTVSSGVAMSRYQEGFDDEPTLRQNLNALGVAPGVLNKYVFAAQLKYLYDYQTDLKTYYIDAYHRRAIEEPELRSNLAASGLLTERIDLVVQSQKIKRLGAAAPESDPSLTVQFDTVRDRRRKSLITRAQEVDALIALGYELPYATAIADNDDVAMTPSGAAVAPVVLKAYETEAGKVEVDTIRRATRARQMSATDEQAALVALAMPADLATAIVDNDSLRLVKVAAA